MKQQRLAVNINELKVLRELSEKNKMFMIELFKGCNELKTQLVSLEGIMQSIYKS